MRIVLFEPFCPEFVLNLQPIIIFDNLIIYYVIVILVVSTLITVGVTKEQTQNKI